MKSEKEILMQLGAVRAAHTDEELTELAAQDCEVSKETVMAYDYGYAEALLWVLELDWEDKVDV